MENQESINFSQVNSVLLGMLERSDADKRENWHYDSNGKPNQAEHKRDHRQDGLRRSVKHSA